MRFSSNRQPTRPKFGKTRTLQGEKYDLVLELKPGDPITLADPFRRDYRKVRVVASTVGGKAVYAREYDPGWKDRPKERKVYKYRYIGKIEKNILRLLYEDNEWMQVNFRYSFSPHVFMPNECSLDLLRDRRHVRVYGVCAQKTVKKMFELGTLKGSCVTDYSFGEPELVVTIELEGEAAEAAMDCDIGNDLIYCRGEGWTYRKFLEETAA